MSVKSGEFILGFEEDWRRYSIPRARAFGTAFHVWVAVTRDTHPFGLRMLWVGEGLRPLA